MQFFLALSAAFFGLSAVTAAPTPPEGDVSVIDKNLGCASPGVGRPLSCLASIQLGVKNKSDIKDVGIRITDDVWTTTKDVPCTYSKDLGNGYEQWSCQTNTNPRDQGTVEFVPFVSFDKGAKIWDPKGNTGFVGSYPGNWKGITRGGVHLDVYGDRAVFKGSVRVGAPSAQDENASLVNIRWTIDDWKTYQDNAAKSFDALNKHAFYEISIPLKKSATVIEYAFHYDTSEGVYWNTQGASNYQHTILKE